MSKLKIFKDSDTVILTAIFLLGVVARFFALDFGLPNISTRPDEIFVVGTAMKFGTGDLNPHFFIYPTFYMYFLFAVYVAYYLLGLALGIFSSLEDFQFLYFTDPTAFYLLNRIIAATLGTVTIFLVYLVGRKFYSRGVGLLSALLLSLTYLHVRDSHFGVLDVPVTFFIVLAYLFIGKMFLEGRMRDYLGAGAIAGLAVSVKYNAALLVMPFLLGHLLRSRGRGRTLKEMVFDRKIWAGILAMPLFFVLTTPFSVLDPNLFLKDTLEIFGYFEGLPGIDLGPGWIYHLAFSLRYGLGLPLLLASLGGTAYALYRHRKSDLLLLSFPLAYYLVAGSSHTVFVRYAIPLLPFLNIFAALLIHDVFGKVAHLYIGKLGHFLTFKSENGKQLGKRGVKFACIGLSVLLLIPSIFHIVSFDRILSQEDTRLLSARWIEENIPSGSKILMSGTYGLPQLFKSRESLLAEVKEKRERKVEANGSWEEARNGYEYRLRLENYPPLPNYEIYAYQRASAIFWILTDLDEITSKDIEYVVVEEYFLRGYSTIPPDLLNFLKEKGTLLKSFYPYDGSEIRTEPVFDQMDAFYVPYSNFGGIKRPGPVIRIYEL
ncbi:ArnT family glycosyltransferase [Candidatus Hakubella thermalkaliphila]|uniref:Glycosyltransferase RgtA/B/C/D-like domain-containing protein n=1 Tax=Candidatus Hakubella thermalkaliphila TaxID=2754717 RepID=A0A6V8P2V3_9ACTN|nr:glycosyltransferase family 39 protein [Candidatus Hakubella thermalkaliphila]GFP26889.1 hypothetical protein HKBW3S33_00303 [Candidatus Hakubella thermalkaliphila]